MEFTELTCDDDEENNRVVYCLCSQARDMFMFIWNHKKNIHTIHPMNSMGSSTFPTFPLARAGVMSESNCCLNTFKGRRIWSEKIAPRPDMLSDFPPLDLFKQKMLLELLCFNDVGLSLLTWADKYLKLTNICIRC